jgi:hypothetical protein
MDNLDFNNFIKNKALKIVRDMPTKPAIQTLTESHFSAALSSLSNRIASPSSSINN